MTRPQPITVTDHLLVDVLDALTEIRDRLPVRPKQDEAEDGHTKVSEPAKPAPARKTTRRTVKES